uniref:Integrase catalytic domain-containing protein n=1 Tax=Fagus sylvatica TaxID=28930 RepID=A0A2N9IUA9_FAGSY
MRCGNCYPDALATLGSQVSFERPKGQTHVTRRYGQTLKTLKDYVLIAGDLYRRLPGGVLARCVSLQEILVATEYFSKWIEVIPLCKTTGATVANFIREHIITRSTPYYPQGNGQAEATNCMLLHILSKMVFDYGKGWSSHLADTLWAYRGSTKTATGFTPFSLVYGTDAISPTELLVPSLRILHGMDLEADADICAEARVADLESLEEARELAQVCSLRYHQKLANAYEKTLQTRIFAKGQMVLRIVDHVRRGLPSPSKFAPNWEGPYLIHEAYDSGYYKLSMADDTILADPINGKWLKRYYS